MSHHALQNALVVALHDAGFVDAMHGDAEATLAPLGLDAGERAQLLAVDRRAFRTDALRARRLLRTLAEEFKASTTLALAETRSLAFAEAFFASRLFRAAVAERRSLAPAFGEYLAEAARTGRLRAPQLAEIVRLELTCARCRRDRDRAPSAGLALAPGVAAARFEAGTLECVQAMEQYLFEVGLMPQVALCDDAPRPPPLPALGGGEPLYLAFTPQSGAAGVSLTEIDEPLHRVLSAIADLAVHGPPSREDVAGALARAARGTAPQLLIDSLLDDGLLAEGPSGA